MNYSIGDFCASNSNAQTYHMDAEINLLVNLFGDWFTYNTLAKYNDQLVNLVVGISDVSDIDNYIKIHVWQYLIISLTKNMMYWATPYICIPWPRYPAPGGGTRHLKASAPPPEGLPRPQKNWIIG